MAVVLVKQKPGGSGANIKLQQEGGTERDLGPDFCLLGSLEVICF